LVPGEQLPPLHTSPTVQPLPVRLLQLRDGHAASSKAACATMLTGLQWKCLWQATERSKKPPKNAPDVAWACCALAKLGGWMPKRGASPGYAAL